MTLLAYPRYVASGVTWLGEVPSHWEVARSDAYVETERRQVDPSYFATEEVIHYSIPAVQATGTGMVEEGESIASAKQIVSEPVLLVSKLNPRKATVCIAQPGDRLTICSTEFVALKARGASLRFLYYMALTESFRQRLDADVQSVTRSHQRASPDQIYRFWAAWPSREEQQAIARFLDAQTAKVDALTANKRALIERLRERRQALISRVITSGLLGDRMSDAGMPAHWTWKPLMRLTDPRRPIMYGIVLPGPDVEDGVPIVKGGDVKPGRLTLDNLCRTSFEIEQGYARSRLRAGDIVFSIRGSIGDAEIVPAEIEGANLTQDAARVASHVDVCERWLLYALRADAVISPLLALSLGATVRGVNIRDLKRVKVPMPPPAEQRAIAEFLDRETVRIDQLIERVEAAITCLQEYRAALIQAAVTGKIDVRNVGAPTELVEGVA